MAEIVARCGRVPGGYRRTGASPRCFPIGPTLLDDRQGMAPGCCEVTYNSAPRALPSGWGVGEMAPRMQSAGTAGIVAGIALAVAFVLFLTSGLMQVLGDPAKALDYFTKNAGRLQLMTALFVIAVAFAVVFVVGLAAKLHDRTPTRASATLYFGLLGLAGHGLGSLIFWAAIPALAAYAAKDQVAAGHAWVAVQALDGAADGMGNLFVGLSALMAGWAIVTTKVLSPVLGWVGVIVGVAGLAVFVSPQNELLATASFVLPIIWLIWAGNALRTAA